MDAQTGQQVEEPTPNKNTPTNQHIVTPPPVEPAIITEHTNDTPTDPFEKEVEEFLQKYTKTHFGEVKICNGLCLIDCGRQVTHIHIDRSSPMWSYTRCEEHALKGKPIPSRILHNLHNCTSPPQASNAKLQTQSMLTTTPTLKPLSNPTHPSPPQQNRKTKGHIQNSLQTRNRSPTHSPTHAHLPQQNWTIQACFQRH